MNLHKENVSFFHYIIIDLVFTFDERDPFQYCSDPLKWFKSGYSELQLKTIIGGIIVFRIR